jgi:hypothetical protein
MDYAAYANELSTHGVVVIPVLSTAECVEWNGEFRAALASFPEYLPDPQVHVLGGFGALGNPSSFHALQVRAFRRRFYDRVSLPLFRAFAETANLPEHKLEMLFDRMGVRSRTQGDLGKEAPHRDVYGGDVLPENDVMFGGWLNINLCESPAGAKIDKYETRAQYFCGLRDTHETPAAHEAQRKRGKFAHISDSEEIAEFRTGMDIQGRIAVPPGCAVIFYQRLAHEVCPGKQPICPSYRLFLGHRLTLSAVPLNSDEVFAELGVPYIPSGQYPPMLSMNHYAMPLYLNKLRSSMKPEVFTAGKTATAIKFRGESKGKTRGMSSLRTVLNYWTSPDFDYSPEDIAIMRPQPL